MARDKTKNKKDIFKNVKEEIDAILLGLEKYPDSIAELYISDLSTAKKLEDLDNILFPLRDGTARGKAYAVDKVINIINPNEPAYDFSVLKVDKYQYVTKKESCHKMIPQTFEVSQNFERRRLQDEFEANNYSKDFEDIRKAELEARLSKERELVEDIIENPDNYSVLISGYMNKVEYEQINYGVKRVINLNDKNISKKLISKMKKDGFVKVRLNKHLSIRKPNIIIYKADSELDELRADMEVKYLEKRGYKIASRGIFYKEIKNKEDLVWQRLE